MLHVILQSSFSNIARAFTPNVTQTSFYLTEGLALGRLDRTARLDVALEHPLPRACGKNVSHPRCGTIKHTPLSRDRMHIQQNQHQQAACMQHQ
jgi:hypothetical protein